MTVPAASSQRPLHLLAGIAWLGWALAVVSLLSQEMAGVYMPHTWLWLPVAAVGGLASVVGGILGLWRLARGPMRWRSLGWGLTALFPLLLWGLLVGYMAVTTGSRPARAPNDRVHRVGRLAGADLMRLHARAAYPSRAESGRLVMYHDGRVADPTGDLARMDEHLAHLEETLGRKQAHPIHWVRGKALGMERVSSRGVALGGTESPAGRLDRHELAHAFLYQWTAPAADPPAILLEGWAVSQETDRARLRPRALEARTRFYLWRRSEQTLTTLASPEFYHVLVEFAYDIGGAWVDFLLRRNGPDRFLELYNTCRSGTFSADCERVYGRDLDALEKEFWDDLGR